MNMQPIQMMKVLVFCGAVRILGHEGVGVVEQTYCKRRSAWNASPVQSRQALVTKHHTYGRFG